MKLRPAQEDVLAWTGGRMAVSAVPGSGKTFTLSLLAARLIAEGRVDPQAGQQILIVTYLNSSADTFKTRLRERLLGQGLPPIGYDARTLHSLSLEIVRLAQGEGATAPAVLDEGQGRYFLARAIDVWKGDYPDLWQAFLPEESPVARVQFRELVENTARVFIRTAKNERYRPNQIIERIDQRPDAADYPFTRMLAGIFERYQAILHRQGALDYDDQVWQAVEALTWNPPLAASLRQRWPYILEDEAQDSVPLQELLMEQLVGPDGNLVRVGDPNQAITSTFTAAHPRFFNAFLRRPDVQSRPLPNSGRNAPIIYQLANQLVDWVTARHPVPEVRRQTFLPQHIQPTPPGDAQPNPPDSEANVVIRLYRHDQEEEIPQTITLARAYTTKFPQRTVAILVPTHYMGHAVAEQLDSREVPYDSLLKGGPRERQIAAALHTMLALLADPLVRRHYKDVFDTLRAINHPAVSDTTGPTDRIPNLLASIHRPEAFVWPRHADELYEALPRGVAKPEEIAVLQRLGAFLRTLFALRPLPVDALALALGDELFGHGEQHEGDLAIAYQIANLMRSWQDLEPDRRLPDLVLELADVAEGRRSLGTGLRSEEGFEPQPGRITLATQHGAKGMEWDAVFMIGLDNGWIPNDLDDYFLGVSDLTGGDPTAQAVAELRQMMGDESLAQSGRSPTDLAHIDVISERLRLLYVGITRARRFLQISRSELRRRGSRELPTQPVQALERLARFVERYRG
jgi:DNA helicase-2/ATP-dependent DNA helicase PcrA